MKPSEFWAQIFALPEQARQAEGEAGELRVRADALTAWAKQVTSAHRDALFAADAEEMGRAVEILNSLPTRPDAATSDSPAEEPAPLPERTRRQRSDAGKPRVRKQGKPAFAIYDSDPDPVCPRCLDIDPGEPSGEEAHGHTRSELCEACQIRVDALSTRFKSEHEAASANPAMDAALAMIAGDVHRAMNDYRNAPSSDPEPVTIGWLMVTLGLPEVVIRDAIKLLSLVSWRMRREGDSQPVEVWGTEAQFREHVRRAWPGLDDEHTAEELGVATWLVTRARKASP